MCSQKKQFRANARKVKSCATSAIISIQIQLSKKCFVIFLNYRSRRFLIVPFCLSNKSTDFLYKKIYFVMDGL